MTKSRMAREQARAILSEGRFHVAPVPRPLHGVLSAIGKALSAPVEALEELFASAAGFTPGGGTTVFAAIAVVALAAGVALALRRSRRALAVPRERAPGERGGTRVSAKELEAAAEAAEGEARYGEAVRLRFRAGVERLAEGHIVAHALSTPNADLSRLLGSERFDSLARTFDEIAYGGRAAQKQDATLARDDWQILLHTVADAATPGGRDVASGVS